MFEWNLNLFLTFSWLFLSATLLLFGIWVLIDCQINYSIINRILHYFYLKDDKPTKQCDISKFYFINFYIIALCINIILFILHFSSFLLFLLFLLHIFRRLYECLYVHQYSFQTTIDYFYYFLRLIHYPCVGLTIIIDYKYSSINLTTFNYFLALILFFNASYIQYNVYLTLAKQIHSIPNHYWIFNSFTCPNSLAEIAIYISFYFASYRTSAMASLMLWIFLNQSLLTLLSHRRYYHKSHSTKQCILIPFIL